MKESKSKFIEYNNTQRKSYDENGNPLNGERILSDDYDNGKITLVRFINGFLDGDVFDKNGKFVMQKPAVESNGHQEYWRQNKLHRDNGEPSVYAEGFSVKEWWENGNRLEDKE